MILRLDRTVQTAQGQAVAGALVYFLTQPADVETLTPLANVFSSSAGAAGTNPQVTDGLGQIGCYLDNGQLYTMVVVSPFLETQVYPDQNLGNSPTTSTTFAQVPAGTINGVNRVFTLTVAPTQATIWLNFPLVPGVGYTLVGNTITYSRAPKVGETLYAQGIF